MAKAQNMPSSTLRALFEGRSVPDSGDMGAVWYKFAGMEGKWGGVIEVEPEFEILTVKIRLILSSSLHIGLHFEFYERGELLYRRNNFAVEDMFVLYIFPPRSL